MYFKGFHGVYLRWFQGKLPEGVSIDFRGSLRGFSEGFQGISRCCRDVQEISSGFSIHITNMYTIMILELKGSLRDSREFCRDLVREFKRNIRDPHGSFPSSIEALQWISGGVHKPYPQYSESLLLVTLVDSVTYSQWSS